MICIPMDQLTGQDADYLHVYKTIWRQLIYKLNLLSLSYSPLTFVVKQNLLLLNESVMIISCSNSYSLGT